MTQRPVNHEEHEKHEDRATIDEDGHVRFGMRLLSPLSSEVETVITRVIGCAIEVHRELGPGFLESIYQRALGIALRKALLSYESEKAVDVMYQGIAIPGQRIDLIVAGAVVVEVKAVKRFDSVHEAQVISYLKTTGLRAGLLINFRVPVLSQGIKRIVL